MTDRLLPILSRTHRPQHRDHPRNPPLRTEQQHAALVQSDPELFKQHPNELPYGVWFTDTHAVLFDSEYRPMFKRPLNPVDALATRADPAEWTDWREVYWLHDNDPAPEYSKNLRDALAMVVEEFCAGRGLWVRRWRSEYAGVLIAHRSSPAPP